MLTSNGLSLQPPIRYLTGWFPVDLVSILPFDSVSIIIKQNPEMMAGFDPSMLRAIRLVRLLRLIKLLRILRTGPDTHS